MSEYTVLPQRNNEPWTCIEGVVKDCEGNVILGLFDGDDDMKERVVSLVNALAGCGNPKEFVEQARDLKLNAKGVMDALEEHGPSIVPHLIDSDENDGERTREALKHPALDWLDS